MSASLRREACPTLRAPMQTGDGLLARLPHAAFALSPEQLLGLSAAASKFGNGIIEITNRGTIQVRGLRPDTADRFAEIVSALGVGSRAGLAILSPPLAGVDPSELSDVRPIVAALRDAVIASELESSLVAKISVIVDGGGTLHSDALSADLRLTAERASGQVCYRLSIGGTATEAEPIGLLNRQNLVPAALAVLRMITEAGPGARAHDLSPTKVAAGIGALIGAIPDEFSSREPRPAAQPLGLSVLRNDRRAVGVGLAFGHVEASMLKALIVIAQRAGATAFAPAGPRVLLVMGFLAGAVDAFLGSAERLGFIVRPDDPRRSLSACAGAPACASGKIATRSIAPGLSAILSPLLDGSIEVHISGCAKGCAHPGPANITIVGIDGGCGLAVAGRANGTLDRRFPASSLPQHLSRFATFVSADRRGGERTAQVLERLGGQAVAALLADEAVGG